MSIFELYKNNLKLRIGVRVYVNMGPDFLYEVLDHNINSKFCRVVMIFERVPGVREYGTGTN